MLLQLIKAVKPAEIAKAIKKNGEYEKTLKLPSLPFLNIAPLKFGLFRHFVGRQPPRYWRQLDYGWLESRHAKFNETSE